MKDTRTLNARIIDAWLMSIARGRPVRLPIVARALGHPNPVIRAL